MAFKHTNKLISETSPYLLQHAHNPVDWYPWGEEALSLAKEQNKPVLVSIGYSACHWCHVMERESFEDEVVADIMNKHFVNIKIDREERPDLDSIYMDAVQTLTGSGGWPLNVFLTPDVKPFYGGTYFPPENMYNRSSWKDVLLAVSTAWKDRQHEVDAQAENLTAHLIKVNTQTGYRSDSSSAVMNDTMCDEIFQNLMKVADKEWGGFGNAPKFPQTNSIQYLLQYAHYYKNEAGLKQALLSIDKILQGGIYDHAGGGIARYSTDKEWLAPHFEKMLYDNALFVAVLCDAFQLTQNRKYEKAIRDILRFVEREMTNTEGAFYAAIDADSEGEEGRYYVWQKKEVEAITGKDAGLFCKYFDITDNGNWENKNILRILKPLEDFAEENNMDVDEMEALIKANLEKLYMQRSSRTRPSLDDKIILSWNGLMLQAFSRAALVLSDDHFKQVAIKNYQVLIKCFSKDNSTTVFHHTCKNGVAKYDAFLDDYAYLADACINLYELTFDEKYLYDAHRYVEYIIENFSDESGQYFYFTRKGAKNLIVRKIEMNDGAIPSANGVMAAVLLKMAVIFENDTWRNRAENMALKFAQAVTKYPGSFSHWATFILQLVQGFEEIAVTGNSSEQIGKEINAAFLPAKVLVCAVKSGSQIPYIKNKNITEGLQIFRCKKNTCLPPFNSIDSFFASV